MTTKCPAIAVPAVRAVGGWSRPWSQFWFTPADPTLLGFIRICAGLFVFYVHLAYTVDLSELLGPHAWVDVQAMHDYRYEMPFTALPTDWSESESAAGGSDRLPPTPEEARMMQKFGVSDPGLVRGKGNVGWSIWYHVTDPQWMLATHALVLVILFLFMSGFCTPVTSVLAWLATVSYAQRAPTTADGMDTMVNLVMLYLMIGPSGAALSLDRLIARYWARRQASRTGRAARKYAPSAPRVAANLALRLLQVHLCTIYLVSGLSKLQGNAWWNGTAIWLTLANPEYSPIRSHLFYAFLQFLCKHRLLWELVMNGGVALTLAVEIGFPFLVWRRSLRGTMLAMAAMMHAGIAVLMGLTMFSLMMLTLLLAFVPPEWIHRLLGVFTSTPILHSKEFER